MADTLMMIDATDLAEVGSLARELADAYRNRIEWYRNNYGDKWAEAFLDREAVSVDFKRRAVTDPPDQVSYSSLSDLATVDPEAARSAWQRVKQTARNELASGHRAALSVEFVSNAWQRAQFLAIRAAFIDQWQPTNGGEQLLLDMLAQTYHQYLAWTHHLTVYTEGEAIRQDKHHLDARYEAPRVTTYEAQEQAAAMVDRFNRLFLRTLRSLRDLRRYGHQIVINQTGHVNIAQQQVNVADERCGGL
jgi:hypothetical protein